MVTMNPLPPMEGIIVRRSAALVTAALALLLTIVGGAAALAAPADGVIHVSASAAAGGNGSAASPYSTIAQAVAAAGNGATIEVADGTYREGEVMVNKSVTIRAAAGAKPVLSGAEVPANWTAGADGTWSTSSDMVRFCTVCTTNPDPSVEGMAAHPEQVFVDGAPLTQVGSRAEVGAGTFYVEDPDPVTLVSAGNNRAGYNAKPHRGAGYVIGVDPGRHTVEVVQHSRALTLIGDSTTLDGLTVEKYSPVQQWDYSDPEIGTSTGGVMVFASGKGLQITNSTFRYSSAGTALGVSDATNATVSGNRFTDNGGVGTGINKSSSVAVERNYWSGNNSEGFNTASCGGYCTIADMKVTHSEAVRYAYNTVDYSASATDHATPASWQTNRQSGIWFDEGVINSQILASQFINVPTAIFNEVSSSNMIASNVVQGAGTGILVAGSDRTQVWNNTISHALTSIRVYEDTRSNGCNSRSADGTCAVTENWSKGKGLSWDTVDTTIYNNILSSEEMPSDGDLWRYSAMLQITGDADTDGSSAVYANEMVTGIDYNVYYRQPTSNPSTTVLWQYGSDRATQSVNASSLSDFTSSPNVTVTGRDANGLDLQGARDSNPIVVREPADPTAWGDYDLRAADGGPADGTGAPLPQDVADALGLSAGTAVDRGALVNVAWSGGQGAAPAGAQAAATSSAAPAPAATGQAGAAPATTAAAGAVEPAAPAATAPAADSVVAAPAPAAAQPAVAGEPRPAVQVAAAPRPESKTSATMPVKVVRTAAGTGTAATIVSLILAFFRGRFWV